MKRVHVLCVTGITSIAILFAILSIQACQKNPAPKETVIASIIPLTGPAAEFGGYNLKACELFAEEYNKSHPKHRIRHLFQDSKSTPKDGINAANALFFSDNPIALQVQLSAVSVAVAPVAQEKSSLLFCIAGTAKGKELSRFAFRNYPDPILTTKQTAKLLIPSQPSTRVAILRVNDEFGISVGAAFTEQLKESNIPLVADESFEKTSTDFRAPVTKILASRPTIVYVVGFGNPLGRVISQLRELGFKGDILGGPEVAFTDVLSIAKEAAEGVKYLDLAFDVTNITEPTKTFVNKYRERYQQDPTAVSAVVYDGWSLLISAIDKANSRDPEKIKTELFNIKDFAGVCGNLTISSERDVVYPLTARIIHQGHPQRLE